MKKIEAFFKPFQIDNVRDQLREIDIQEIIISDVRCSAPKQQNESYLSDDSVIEFLPKIRVEVFVEDSQAQKAISKFKQIIDSESSSQAAMLAKIFVFDVSAT